MKKEFILKEFEYLQYKDNTKEPLADYKKQPVI